jgi:anti-anti-sigma factor
MLRIEIQSAEPVANLFCSGRIVLGVEAETLRCVVNSRPEKQLLLHMGDVYAIDAAGLGLLVQLHHWSERRRTSLIIANPSRQVKRLLALTRLDRILPVCNSGVVEIPKRASEEWRTMTA